MAAIEESAETYLRDGGGLEVLRWRRWHGQNPLQQAEFGRDDWRVIVQLGWPGILVPAE